MEYKTQVFIPHEGDHYRTRLTHTIEVAQVSRTLARNLRLNEDLTEAIALVHDIGHTPFGHSGEDALDDLLHEQGGFNHNHQSLRLADLLEQRYEEHPGLNLSYEVREGIIKHETKALIRSPEFDDNLRPTLEASLVDLADELTYSSHDVDDGLYAGLIESADVLKLLAIREALDRRKIKPEDRTDEHNATELRHLLVRSLIDLLATDLLTETSLRVERFGLKSVDDVRESSGSICAYSAGVADAVLELKKFLSERLYHHPRLIEMSDRSKLIVSGLFSKLTLEPGLMPARYRVMLESEDKSRVVADYIAGMTDRYAEEMYRQHCS